MKEQTAGKKEKEKKTAGSESFLCRQRGIRLTHAFVNCFKNVYVVLCNCCWAAMNPYVTYSTCLQLLPYG